MGASVAVPTPSISQILGAACSAPEEGIVNTLISTIIAILLISFFFLICIFPVLREYWLKGFRGVSTSITYIGLIEKPPNLSICSLASVKILSCSAANPFSGSYIISSPKVKVLASRLA